MTPLSLRNFCETQLRVWLQDWRGSPSEERLTSMEVRWLTTWAGVHRLQEALKPERANKDPWIITENNQNKADVTSTFIHSYGHRSILGKDWLCSRDPQPKQCLRPAAGWHTSREWHTQPKILPVRHKDTQTISNSHIYMPARNRTGILKDICPSLPNRTQNSFLGSNAQKSLFVCVSECGVNKSEIPLHLWIKVLVHWPCQMLYEVCHWMVATF